MDLYIYFDAFRQSYTATKKKKSLQLQHSIIQLSTENGELLLCAYTIMTPLSKSLCVHSNLLYFARCVGSDQSKWHKFYHEISHNKFLQTYIIS